MNRSCLLPVLLLTAAIAVGAGPVKRVAAKTIYVKVLVDEEEPGTARQWQSRLQRRFAAASTILKPYCDIEFSPLAFGTWKTDNRVNDFSRSLREFETAVRPQPADIAVGFTSQYRFTRGRHHLGGTRGPLYPHILIRESNPAITEIERVEVLVHELGHYLGAAHSPRRDSVMRPVVGDGQARSRTFHIAFDPENAEAVRLVSRDVRDLGIRRFTDLSVNTKLRVRSVYARLMRQLPGDPAALKYVQIINQSLRPASTAPQRQPLPR